MCADNKHENDDRSPRREEVRGKIRRGERFFVQRVFVEKLSPWTNFSVERSPQRRLLGESLQGETLSMERTAEDPQRVDSLEGLRSAADLDNSQGHALSGTHRAGS